MCIIVYSINTKCFWSFLIGVKKNALIRSKATCLSHDIGSCKGTVGSCLADSFWLLQGPDQTVKWRHNKSPLSYLRAHMEHSYPIPGTGAAFILYSLGWGSGWRLDQRPSCFFFFLFFFCSDCSYPIGHQPIYEFLQGQSHHLAPFFFCTRFTLSWKPESLPYRVSSISTATGPCTIPPSWHYGQQTNDFLRGPEEKGV